ncbi:MAG: sigma-70 family RNA polymerase sigma factor [Acidimicrobiales bacterium]
MSEGELALPAGVPASTRAGTDPVDAAQVVAAFREEHGPMVRLGYLLLGDVEEAEDVVQSAYATLVERWDRVREPGAYLRRCVVNGCYDVLRRRRRRRSVPLADPVPAVAAADEYLLDAVQALPPKQRIVVVLRYYQGLRSHEVAACTGWPEGTVKSLHHRALATLRGVIEP